MTILSSFEAEHRELADAIARLRRLVAGPGPDEQGELPALRWRFAFLIARHISVEDTHLYPRIAADKRPEVARVVARFHGKIGALKERVQRYQTQWTPGMIAEQWPAFQAETLALLNDVEERIAVEEAELFPLIAEAERQSRMS